MRRSNAASTEAGDAGALLGCPRTALLVPDPSRHPTDEVLMPAAVRHGLVLLDRAARELDQSAAMRVVIGEPRRSCSRSGIVTPPSCSSCVPRISRHLLRTRPAHELDHGRLDLCGPVERGVEPLPRVGAEDERRAPRVSGRVPSTARAVSVSKPWFVRSWSPVATKPGAQSRGGPGMQHKFGRRGLPGASGEPDHASDGTRSFGGLIDQKTGDSPSRQGTDR
jgi:hypothetical protein